MTNAIFGKGNILRIIVSVSCLYMLAPNLDRRVGVLISLAFALLNIFAARLLVDQKHWGRASAYVGISVFTYYILFNDQPWNLIHHHGIFDDSPLPLVVCSIIMSMAGGLLLKGWKARILYLVITLGVQVPIGIFVGGGLIQQLFEDMSHALHYEEFYLESWAVWQFEWMLTYHLPFYFLSRVGKDHKS